MRKQGKKLMVVAVAWEARIYLMWDVYVLVRIMKLA